MAITLYYPWGCSSFDRFIITGYRFIKSISLSTEEMYGLEAANIEIEKVPIQVGPLARVKMKRRTRGTWHKVQFLDDSSLKF